MSIPKSNSSNAWKHFIRDPNTPDEAICTHCKKSYKRSNGNTNLLDHLKRKHFTVLNRCNLQQQIKNDTNQTGK